MYKRVIIKISTGIVSQDDRLLEDVVGRITKEVADLRKRGVEAVIVTSGAVATGKGLLSFSGKVESVPQKQMFAAVGQIGLMSLYAALFKKEGCHCAQVLVTKEDFRDREHYLHMKDCFENLLREGVIPIANENDAIAAPGVAFTDNDELAGFIASQLGAEAVIMLSSVDGVLNEEGTAIPEICLADADTFKKCISSEHSPSGRGGMLRKFEIAKRLMAQGIATHIVNGSRPGSITDIVDGNPIGTRFIPDKKLSAPKRRIAHSEGLSAGAAYVNKGAEEVLLSDKTASLLPVGIVRVEGAFKKGDTIEILNEKGTKLGYGIAQYGIEKARELVGKKGARALVHCDYLFIG